MDVLMPQLGETVVEGTVSVWHKQVGDRVAKNEILLDVETDKVSMEIPAPGAGRIRSLLVAAGQTVVVGTVLAVIDAEGEAAGVPAMVQTAPPAVAPGPVTGAAASIAGSPSRPAPPATESAAAAAGGATSGPATARAVQTASRTDSTLRLSPAVRSLVAEHTLDPGVLAGTGHHGRITRRDVLAHLAAPASHAVATRPTPPAAVAPGLAPRADGQFVPFNRIRRLTAEHMVRSKATSPHVLQAIEVDFSAVERCRQAVKDAWRARHGHSLTYMPFIAHSVSSALGEFPHLNASVEGDGLRLHARVNLAVAVDLGPQGLVAPVLRHSGGLGVAELARAIHALAERARAGTLLPDEFAGGTYTLSNSGVFGTLITAPVINQPQVAILSIDGVRKRPVVLESPDGDSIAIRPVGVLAQSFDHRAIDGAYSAAFLARLKSLIEQTTWQMEI
jgi:pyruvate dehydrogenase E2 component (dihydrolipoamide acetyltransferase)